MARIFISYSRADVLFVEELVPLLQSVYPRHQIWYDQRIFGGEDWWQMILGEIHACDIFLYLMSNDSLESEYCQAEFTEALRLQKACVPVIIRPKTTIENAPEALRPEIKRRNWVDLSGGFKDAKANARLYSSINKYIDALPPTPPPPLSPHPIAQPQITIQTNTQVSIPKSVILPIVALLILIVVVAIVALISSQNTNNDASTPQPTNTSPSVAVVTDAPTPDLGAFLAGTQTREVQLTDLARPTATPTLTPNYDATLNAMASQTVAARLTNMPTPHPTSTEIPQLSATLDAEAMTLVFPFTATARANLPSATQTALSVQETQIALDTQNTQRQVSFYATETAVITLTSGVQTLQAIQMHVGATATAHAENITEFIPFAEITAPVIENVMVVVTDDSRLYQLPDTSSEVILSLLFGDELNLFGIHPNGAWFYVEIQDQIQGWVPRFPNNQLEAYVSGTLIENLPILDLENPTAPSYEVFGVHMIVTNEVAINVREYASFDERANIFAGLQPYSVARIDATSPSGSWLLVSFVGSNNRTVIGWVSATLLDEERITIIGDLASVIKVTPLPLP